MENKKQERIRKIKKLMAIAYDPNASKGEVIEAMALAQRQMIKFKIDEDELGLGDDESKEVYHWKIDGYYLGLFHLVYKVISDNFRCSASYFGRINSNKCGHSIHGMKKDVEFVIPLIEGVTDFLNKKMIWLQKVCLDDVKLAKRDYIYGFANGLKKAFKESMIEMKLDEKQELMILDKPEILKKYLEVNTTVTKQKYSKPIGITPYYNKGYDDGKKYNVKS